MEGVDKFMTWWLENYKNKNALISFVMKYFKNCAKEKIREKKLKHEKKQVEKPLVNKLAD